MIAILSHFTHLNLIFWMFNIYQGRWQSWIINRHAAEVSHSQLNGHDQNFTAEKITSNIGLNRVVPDLLWRRFPVCVCLVKLRSSTKVPPSNRSVCARACEGQRGVPPYCQDFFLFALLCVWLGLCKLLLNNLLVIKHFPWWPSSDSFSEARFNLRGAL